MAKRALEPTEPDMALLYLGSLFELSATRSSSMPSRRKTGYLWWRRRPHGSRAQGSSLEWSCLFSHA